MAGGLDLCRFHVVYTRAGRPAAHGLFEAQHRIHLAFCQDLDAAVVLVPHVAAHPFPPCGILDKQPEAHTLYPAPDDVSARHKHERELYTGRRRGTEDEGKG
jgi:hypothetical protein